MNCPICLRPLDAPQLHSACLARFKAGASGILPLPGQLQLKEKDDGD